MLPFTSSPLAVPKPMPAARLCSARAGLLWAKCCLMRRGSAALLYRSTVRPSAISCSAARQIVSHGHIYLNGKKTNVASARVKPGDVVELGKKAQDMALVLEAQSLAERDIPEYIAPDGAAKISFVRVPTLDEVPYPVKMEPNLVVEFYSR